jgi:hypothetical protein
MVVHYTRDVFVEFLPSKEIPHACGEGMEDGTIMRPVRPLRPFYHPAQERGRNGQRLMFDDGQVSPVAVKKRDQKVAPGRMIW